VNLGPLHHTANIGSVVARSARPVPQPMHL